MIRASWLLPVRDGRRWLGEAVASALAECGPDDELIVIDDGSVDQPAQALPDDPRLRLIRQDPLGIVAALERGRAAARGRFLARLDADDVALPGRLAAQVAALEADPGLGVIGGRAQIRREDGPVPDGMRLYVESLNSLTDLHRELLVESPLFHPAVLMRAEAVAAVGGYRPGDLPEDYDLWLRLAGAGWRLGALTQAVVLLRDRSDRLTRTDPRYRKAAFHKLKMDWVEAHLLPARGRRLAIWGAGRTGRPWIRWAEGLGCPALVVDEFAVGERRGRPIARPEALAEAPVDLLLVAVAARGARALIRARLAALRPDWQEGRDWWAVA